MEHNPHSLTRRSLLAAAGGAGLVAASPWPRLASAASADLELVAEAARVRLVPTPYPETDVWSFNGIVPGPEIRVRQGDRLRVAVTNRLDEETTVHWHGIRLPNAMDGVPHLTQKPIAPGETFLYEFDLLDAGTFWYHPHQRSFEQAGRGLSGALIVEEREPIEVDRDVTWVLDDWRLVADASIRDDFGNRMDMAMAGRIGNTVTINGRVRETFACRAGERIRLRLINVANARIFGLDFRDHEPHVVALDGHPIAPYPLPGRLTLGPGERADLVIDMTGAPGERYTVVDNFYWRNRYRLLDLAYSEEPPLRQRPPEASLRLAANPLPEPDLDRAERHDIVFGGGMGGGMGGMGGGMGGMMGDMGGMMGDMGGMMGGMMGRMGDTMAGMMGVHAWSVNGVSVTDHRHAPLITLERDATCRLAMRNETAFHHPIHLHGHAFRVLSRNGRPTPRREWKDTVMMAPNESVEIAFVADNPGDWMIHCHILEHQAGGMMGAIRVL
jgi:FtsP/CotA-like multicopper oxidase with cupredoxin domain